jgi:hypothetical protein
MTTPPPPPAATPYTIRVDVSRLPDVATALGVSLVSAAIVTSAMYSRKDGHLDASNFTTGVLCTLGLLVLAAGARALVGDPARRDVLVSWPGAFGAAGVGVMLATLITKHTLSEHVAPLAALAIAVAGYLLVRSAPFVLVALGSLALLYERLFDDLFDLNTDGNGGGNVFMLIGGGVLVFIVLATALGWLLPATRVLTGVVTGLGGLAAMVVLLGTVAFTRAISVAFSGSFDSSSGSGSSGSSGYSPLPSQFGAGDHTFHDPYKNDVYMILLYCAALAAIWFVCALVTGHVGFRLLVLADALVVVPLATIALVAHHPTWWEVVTAAIGGLVLVGVALGAVNRPGPGAPAAATAEPPVAPPMS